MESPDAIQDDRYQTYQSSHSAARAKNRGSRRPRRGHPHPYPLLILLRDMGMDHTHHIPLRIAWSCLFHIRTSPLFHRPYSIYNKAHDWDEEQEDLD